MLTANKGEWSEIYTLLKIISDKNLFAGDSDLNKIENLVFPIIKILRDESKGTYQYSYESDLIIIKGNEEEFRIPISQFHEKAILLLSKLKESTNATFSIPEIENFMQSFNCLSIKAKSIVKSDIKIVIHDQRTGTTPELGFSIKSQLGGASTLLNAGKTTNFVYKVLGNFQTTEIDTINSLVVKKRKKESADLKGRTKAILKIGDLQFKTCSNQTFLNNLMLIDSSLPQIIADVLIKFNSENNSALAELIKETANDNPLKFDMSGNHNFYHYKIKKLLTDIALGMMPSKVWSGQLDATGGYLIVKKDGEILCYHIYNRNEFDDYLLANTKLETASSSRHDFGKIYSENDELFFKLNLQIRFLR
jgi:type II restriction enzyme